MSKSTYLAFRKEYSDITLRLTTEAVVADIAAQKADKVTALWDTGAMLSSVTPAIARNLNLIPTNKIKVNGVNNISMADVTRLTIELPNQVVLQNIKVVICNLVEGIDLLIGMDIIKLGDLSISNGGGKTLFSFAIPPFDDKTDFYEKAVARNETKNL